MSIVAAPIIQQLKDRMQWLQARQKVLSENVANADTPRFRPRDLRDRDAEGSAKVSVETTNAAHIGASPASGAGDLRAAGRFETRPSGNAVELEDEMMKVAQTQMDYQLAATLYAKSLGLLKLAVGKR